MLKVGSKAYLGARLVLGLIFFVFGLNGFLQFLPMPPMNPEAGAFIGGLAGSGYFFPLLKAIEVICGAALLANWFVPLSLTILAPIVINIFAFHLFLDPAGIGFPIVIVLLEVFLACAHKADFAPLLKCGCKSSKKK